MVRAVLRASRAGVPVKTVRATRGKWLRAEPVAAMYEQGRVKHVGALPELEDQMCDFGLGGLSAGALARPARCAGLGGDRIDHAPGGRSREFTACKKRTLRRRSRTVRFCPESGHV